MGWTISGYQRQQIKELDKISTRGLMYKNNKMDFCY